MMPLLAPEGADAVRQAIRHFEEGLIGCDEAEIDRMVAKLAIAYRSERLSDDEAKARNALYADLLGDIPFDILARAFRAAGQTCRFFPTVAEIRKLAFPELNKRQWRLFCLRRLLAKFERDYRPPLTPEELCKPEEARSILEETFGKMGAKPDDENRAERRTRSKRRAAPKAPRGTSARKASA